MGLGANPEKGEPVPARDYDEHADDAPPTATVDCEMCAGSGEGRPGGPLCRHCRGTGEREVEL